jgi:hypothetical protein
MEGPIMHQLADRDEAKLSPNEIAFVVTILEGKRLGDAMAEVGLTGPAAAAAVNRAIDYLRPFARGLTGGEPASAAPETGSTMSDLTTVLSAVGRLPRRALAGLAARHVRRLLPSVALFAEGLPDGREQFRALEAALQGVECFAAGQAVPSGLADLVQAVRRFRGATPGLGEGEIEDLAYACLFTASAALSLVVAPEQGGRFDLSTAFKMCDIELSQTGLLPAAAADARRLLDSGVDLSEGLTKLGDAPGVHPLGLLWPEGEPDWHRQEVAQMSKPTEENSSPLPEPEATAGEQQSSSDATRVGVQISPVAFLRSMMAIFWGAFRHPFRTDEVDLSTGQVVRHY